MDSVNFDDLDFDPVVKQLMNGDLAFQIQADEKPSSRRDPQEHELAEFLIELTQKYGKFNEDGTGVWAGYKPAKDNKVKDIGVKCANCALYEGGTSCKIIAMPVEEEAKCRFAIIHDGIVKNDKSKE